jgi:hypothetical protein
VGRIRQKAHNLRDAISKTLFRGGCSYSRRIYSTNVVVWSDVRVGVVKRSRIRPVTIGIDTINPTASIFAIVVKRMANRAAKSSTRPDEARGGVTFV